MKTKTTKELKVGDKVYALYNSVWGMAPMKIVEVKTHGYICESRDFSESGYFCKGSLAKVTDARRKALSKLRAAKIAANKLRDELFSAS